jgi:hypothetical protein
MGLAVNPSVQLLTSPKSVAGRGVFAVDDLNGGDLIARIPSALVLYPENGAACFPKVARDIESNKIKAGIFEADDRKFRWIHKLWQKVVRRKETLVLEFMEKDETCMPELTLYALAALEADHPWSPWISQWNRDDPAYRLFASNAKPYQEDVINDTAKELNSIMPDLPLLHLKAALTIRLGRLEEERSVFYLKDNTETSSMYSVLSSRIIELNDMLVGAIPFHDMINHSLKPNVSIEFNGEWIELFSNRKVENGEELFLCYTKMDEELNENNALWALIQWGIPLSRDDYCVTGI